MTSTTPKTLRHANYIVYTACALGISGLAIAGLVIRDDPEAKPRSKPGAAATSSSANKRPQAEQKSFGAGSKLEPQDSKQQPQMTALPMVPPPTAPATPNPVQEAMPPSSSVTSTAFVAQPERGLDRKPSPLGPIPSTPPVTHVSPPTVTKKPAFAPATATQRAQIVAAIERGDRAEMKALRRLDLAAVRATHAGKAQNMLRDAVEELKKKGLYVASEYNGAKVDAVSVSSDGQNAQVRTTETWESSWYDSQTHTCKAHVHKRPVPQTIFLSQSKQGWVISDVKHDNQGPLPFVACHI